MHDDPEMNEFLNITDVLQEHPEFASELIFEEFNDTCNSHGADDEFNPLHFQSRIFAKTVDENGCVVKERDLIPPYNERHLSNCNIKVIDNCCQLSL